MIVLAINATLPACVSWQKQAASTRLPLPGAGQEVPGDRGAGARSRKITMVPGTRGRVWKLSTWLVDAAAAAGMERAGEARHAGACRRCRGAAAAVARPTG